MAHMYLLEWLDLTVTLTLNPSKTDLSMITAVQSKEIIEKAEQETRFIQSQFTIQVFSLTKEKQIKILVGNYYSTMLFLLDEITEINSCSNLDSNYLKEVMDSLISCLHELILFIESRFANYLTTSIRIIERRSGRPAQVNNLQNKVLCKLSTDQAALIIRASDELKILIAKSMNQVFKTIVPHLSTPHKKDLSYDSMRSKSYVAEERDKEMAISALKQIIKKIQTY